MENLKVEQRGKGFFLSLSGEITLEVTAELKNAIDAETEQVEFSVLVMDLSEVSFMDSSGIGFLVALTTRLKGQGRALYLYMPSTQVRKTLELVQLSNFFHIIADDDELIALLPG